MKKIVLSLGIFVCIGLVGCTNIVKTETENEVCNVITTQYIPPTTVTNVVFTGKTAVPVTTMVNAKYITIVSHRNHSHNMYDMNVYDFYLGSDKKEIELEFQIDTYEDESVDCNIVKYRIIN